MPTVSIISPSLGSTVGTNFTVTGTVTGISGPIPSPPPLEVAIRVGDAEFKAKNVSMNDSGTFTATFEEVPAGTEATITATWTPTDDSDSVGNITVE